MMFSFDIGHLIRHSSESVPVCDADNLLGRLQ
jgi:hypothetical protein